MDTEDEDLSLASPGSDEPLETDDLSKVIELSSHRNENHGRGAKTNGGKSHDAKYTAILQRTLKDHVAAQAAELTPEEEEFIDLFVGGTSVSRAFELTHPSLCVKLDRVTREPILKDGKPIPLTNEQVHDKGDKLLATVRIRARMKHMLEQEALDVKHTSQIISNFVLKRLMHEATEASTPAARISALKELRSYGVVAAREEELTKNATTPDEVKREIDALLKRLGA